MNVAEGQRILKEVQSEFKECVDAGAIAQKARMEKIISEAVEIQIIESKSLDAAKEVLFEHLHNQVTLEGLRSFCSIMIESEGYQLMQKFGKGLLTKLEEVMPRPGSSQVSSAAASDVEMEGGIEPQHTLIRAQRKRPPEDHADHEWKRQKDSDSAGGAASYALGEAWRKRPPEDHAEREWKRPKYSDTADRKAVVPFVHPAYDVEEADRYYLKKAIMTVAKNKKLDTLKLMRDLYRHTYYSVERILEANPQHFRHMVRAAELATEDEEDAMALTTTRTVAELLDKLRIKTKWEDTERLAEIVLCLPKEPRTLAMSFLKRYEGYLEVYDNLVPAQDSLQMQLAVPEGTKSQVPVEVTVMKHLDEFMNKDCKDIVNLLLHNSYKIPRINIMVADIQPGSTTVVFLIDKAFTENIIHSSRQVSPLWAFQELRVTRVHFGDFELNVVQLLTQHFKEAIRSGLTGCMDFVGATKALPYQVYALVDPDISEKLVIRTVYGKIARPYSEQEELVSGTADSEDNEGVESTPEMEEDTLPPKVEEEAELDDEGKIKETTDSGELRSRVQELEEELKNSEGKMMGLTHENMALVNHLKVCQKQKDHTEQEITSLKKRLFSMLSSQGGADKDSALTAPSGVCSKRIPHRWWLKVSAGSYDTSLIPSSLMKQAEDGREMEGEVVFRRDTKSNLLKAVTGTEWMYQRGALERGRQANLRQHQFTRFHRRWLADNVQKEEEDSCKLWLLQLTPDVGTVREREEHQVDEGKMSEEVTGSGELLSRVQELEDELKDSEQKRMDLIQSNADLQKILKACREQEDEGKTSKEVTGSGELLSPVQELEDELKDSEQKRMDLIQSNAALQKILKACREQEVRAQQEIASLWERLGGADQDSAPTAPSEGPLKRIPHRWWLKVSAGSYDTSLLPSSPMKQAEGGREMEGEVMFRRDTKSNLLKAVSGTEWMYRRGALERDRRSATAKLHQHQFTRYHRSWLVDNVQKEEEESCKQWLLQSSPDVGGVREGEEQELMSKVCKQALRDYQEKIAEVLIVENIILNLEPYLTKEEYLQVKGKLGNMAQVDELFRILLTKGNRHFKGFCHVLEDNGYPYWAQQLRSSTDGAETEGANQDSAPTAPSEDPLKRIPRRWWLKVSAGSYDASLLLSSPMKQAEGGREMEGEVVFRRDTKSYLLKAVSGTEWMYRRGALERGRQLHQHQFTRYHQSWLADNVQKEEEESCKQWLLQSSPDVSSVREGEEQGLTAYSRLKPDKKAEALDLLHSVTKNGYREQFLELAYDHGVPPAENGMEGHSAVHLIAEHGHVQLMRDLLTKELPEIAEVLQDGLHFREQLERAKKHQNMVTPKLGKYVKNKSKHGWRPLHFAVKTCASQQVGERGKKMVALLLLTQGDNLMQKSVRAKKSGEEPKRNKSDGESPVHIAAKCGTLPALELIWEWCNVFGTEGEHGGKFEPFKQPDEKGWTPLHHAVAANQSIVVEWLLAKRPLTRLSVDAPSEKGYTALMTAAEYSRNEMCELLLRNRAKVDCAAADGLTAIHLAAMHDNKELVELLLERGASCKDQDKDGNTPLHIARKNDCVEAASVLESHDRTMLEVENNDGYTPKNIPREDKEFIPPEIRERGSKAIRVYEEALKDGKTKIPHVKFVLLGETRHGKTSLLRLLEGEEFDPDSSSTNGIDCDLVSNKTVDGMDEGSWKKHDSLSYLEAVAGILVRELPQSDTPAIRQRSHPGDLTKEYAEQQIAKLFCPPPSVVPHGGHPSQAPSEPEPVSEVARTQEQHKFQEPSSQLSPAEASQSQPGVGREHTRHQRQQQKRDTSVQEEGASRPQIPEESNPGTTGKHPKDAPAKLLSDPKTGRAIQRAMLKVKGVEQLAFTTYDFAGQPLYRPMHHCFITQRSVFAIVYNAREFLDTPREARSKFISYWFNTVSAYTESYTEEEDRQLGNKPPVFYVGTHRGPYEAEDSSRSFEKLSDEEMQYVTDVLEDHFENNDKCGRYVPHITTKSYNFVESSLKGKESGAQVLRSHLREKAKSLPYMKEEYPVRWLKLEEDLTSKDGLILLADVKKKARELNFHFAEETESKELDEALRFFHEIGVITYPRSLPHIFLEGCDQEARQLEEVILCGPAQLPNVMKKVVNFRERFEEIRSANDRKELKQTSVASEKALAELFEDVPTGSICDKRKALQCFCLLLRAYGLIVRMDTGRDEASHQQEGRQSPPGPQYLIPCLLKKMHNIPKPARRCFSFVADFLGYLPQEVFMRFICLAALRADRSILNCDKTDDAKYHLKQDYCSVEDLATRGDAWYISCDPSNHKMVFEVSEPHDCTGAEMEFVGYASRLLDELCTSLKLNGLLYRVGAKHSCKSCEAENFIKLHENGRTIKHDEIKCSCTMPIKAHDLLNQTATGMKRLATQFSASEFLKKHETEFFEVVNPRLSLLRLVRKGVITEDVKSDITTSNTKDAREVLYHHLAHHANVDTLKEYCEVAIDAEGYPKMRSLGRKMMEELEQGGEQTH